MKSVLRFFITAFAGVMALAGTQSFAADKGGTMANFSGHMRTRFEIVDNQGKTSTKWGEQFLNRARVNMDLMPVDSLKVRIAPQATWQWENPGTNQANMYLHEGWMAWMPSDSVSLWVGRQEIVFGKERIFTDSDWGQRGVSHDAARVQFSYDMGTSHLFWVKNAENHFDGSDVDGGNITAARAPDTDLLALYNSFNLSEQTGFINTVDVYGTLLWNGNKAAKTTYFMMGALVDGAMNAFDYNTEIAAQFGKFGGAKSQKGMLVALDAGYTFMEKHRVGMQGVMTNREWRDLVGTDHGHLGHSDLASFGNNLMALALNTDFKFTDQFDAGLDGWWFMKNKKGGATAGGILPAVASSSKQAGYELDMTLGYNPEDNLRFETGYALFISRGYAKDKKQSDMYVSGTLKF